MRRGRLAIVAGMAALLAATWLGGPWAPTGAPSMHEVKQFTPGDVILWDPDSRLVVFELGGRLVLDRLVIDRSPYLELPMPPRWRVTGDWFSVPAANSEVARGGIAPVDVGCWCARPTPIGEQGAVVVFGRFPAALAGQVAEVVLEAPWGEPRATGIVLGERGFLVTTRELNEAEVVVAFDADGERLRVVELLPADG